MKVYVLTVTTFHEGEEPEYKVKGVFKSYEDADNYYTDNHSMWNTMDEVVEVEFVE